MIFPYPTGKEFNNIYPLQTQEECLNILHRRNANALFGLISGTALNLMPWVTTPYGGVYRLMGGMVLIWEHQRRKKGISSKAAGTLENKKKYNGIDYENDLDLNVYDAQFRELDAQIGRWWQIDPKTEEMYMWSTYTSNFDNPIRYLDPLGDEASNDCCGGWWKNFKTSVSDFSDKFGYLYRKNVGTPIKSGLSNLKNNWENGNLPIQKAAKGFAQEAMANPISLLGPAELKGVGGAIGVELNVAERGIISLDNNALIHAIENNGKSAVKNAIGTDKPIVSITAAKEFLVKGDKAELRNFMTEVGATVSKKGASASQVQNLQSAASATGRVLGKNDASIMGGAINNNATILTNDKRFINILIYNNLKVKSF